MRSICGFFFPGKKSFLPALTLIFLAPWRRLRQFIISNCALQHDSIEDLLAFNLLIGLFFVAIVLDAHSKSKTSS